MAWTQAELDALKAAYASGTTRVSYNGRTVEYDSGAALLQRIRVIEAEVAAGGAQRRPRVAYATFSRW